jgi:hypothetical protein
MSAHFGRPRVIRPPRFTDPKRGARKVRGGVVLERAHVRPHDEAGALPIYSCTRVGCAEYTKCCDKDLSLTRGSHSCVLLARALAQARR